MHSDKPATVVVFAAIATAAVAVSLPGKTGRGAELVPPAPEHFWPHARGAVPGQFGNTAGVAPADLDSALAWSWHHPGGRYHTTVAGGPVIDSARNLYLTTNDGIRKFSPDGGVLWHYSPPGDTNNEPVLMGSAVYGNTNNGHAFALDLESGRPLWVTRPGLDAGKDVGYPAAYDGVYVMGVEMGRDPRHPGGNQRVVALDGSSGATIWDFRPERPVWNLMPVFPGDGTCVFMDFSGDLYRLGLHNGTLVWHAHAPGSEKSFTDGGVILGPDGATYTCSNPGQAEGSEGTLGALRSFALDDGRLLWEQILPQPCNSWPAVGRLGGSPGLSVVVTPGSFMGDPVLHGGIMSFEAATGEPQWQYQAPEYRGPHGMAKGDVEGFRERQVFDPEHAICLPAHWSAPTISGDGTVFAGRCDGRLYVVHGPASTSANANGSRLAMDFSTTRGVVATTFDAEGASLHGATAFAPGMMAFATCDTLFVFRY